MLGSFDSGLTIYRKQASLFSVLVYVQYLVFETMALNNSLVVPLIRRNLIRNCRSTTCQLKRQTVTAPMVMYSSTSASVAISLLQMCCRFLPGATTCLFKIKYTQCPRLKITMLASSDVSAVTETTLEKNVLLLRLPFEQANMLRTANEMCILYSACGTSSFTIVFRQLSALPKRC